MRTLQNFPPQSSFDFGLCGTNQKVSKSGVNLSTVVTGRVQYVGVTEEEMEGLCYDSVGCRLEQVVESVWMLHTLSLNMAELITFPIQSSFDFGLCGTNQKVLKSGVTVVTGRVQYVGVTEEEMEGSYYDSVGCRLEQVVESVRMLHKLSLNTLN
ncbi:hypothetical protein CEXT_447751 [Caerostris extrusa]|uniref:Uncharacterized protein n=1 Tax=Caerostris extrusa TaxID=172846 RepID=A0AAV4V2G4_CAEEX|nr:hypothetical protein CEXT_447751 [Caerostris extrusa]